MTVITLFYINSSSWIICVSDTQRRWLWTSGNSRGSTPLSTSKWRSWKVLSSWVSTHTDSLVKKAQQRLFNLRRLNKFVLSPKTLTNFYRYTIESILSGCITAWFGNCSAHNCKALQRVVRSAQRITGGKLPALQDTYTTRCHRKAIKIIKDDNHPSHCLFTPLSSRRRGQYRCIKAGTERQKNSFYLKAIRLLNSHH